MQLIRNSFTSDGIFGSLYLDGESEPLCDTLEHAYLQDDGSYLPKIPYGEYVCVRGTHQLAHGGPFETFEVIGVPGHSGILFHPGNTNQDSEGCILLGTRSGQEVINSRQAFAEFMAGVGARQSFRLTVARTE